MQDKLLSLPILALFALAVAFAGGMMVRLGLRGRRIDDHPVCRKCGFDLFGLPDDRKVCPECGSDLSARRAVQIGHYERRRGLLWSGVSLLLLIGMIVAVGGSGILRNVNWQRVKPAAWVAWEARGGSKLAWVELTRRVTTGELSPAQAQSVADDALAWQKDLTRKWDPAVGDFVEAARHTITDEQWKAYATQALTFTLRIRSKVRKGDLLTAQVVFGQARVANSSRLSVRFEKPAKTDDPLVDLKRLTTGRGYTQSSLGGGGGMSSNVYLPLQKKVVEAASPGKRTTEVTLTAEIREAWETPGIEVAKEVSDDWELLPADAQVVEVVPDEPKLRKQMAAAVQVDTLEVSANSGATSDTSVNVNLKIAALPVPISHDVFLREGQREWKVSSLATSGPVNYGLTGWFPAKDKNPFDAQRVDVILRPATRPALSTVDIFRRWDGELVIPNIGVKWPATQPTAQP